MDTSALNVCKVLVMAKKSNNIPLIINVDTIKKSHSTETKPDKKANLFVRINKND